MLTEGGFTEPTFHGWTGYFTSPYTQGGLITARKPGGGGEGGVSTGGRLTLVMTPIKNK
jgi:hypothetical protein